MTSFYIASFCGSGKQYWQAVLFLNGTFANVTLLHVFVLY